MKIQAICWDMDGTLINNHDVFENAVAGINSKYNLSYIQEYQTGSCLHTLWACLENPQNISFDLWGNEINSLCIQGLSQQSLRPYVKETLTLFKDNSLSQSCVSNSPDVTIETNLRKTEIIHLFKHWVGRDSVKEGKPSPESYLYSCKLHDIFPQQALAIEDSKVGIK